MFELATLDNWSDTLYAVMDINGYNNQPRQNADAENAVFFIVFVSVSAHFMIKAFIAVFIEQVRRLLALPQLLCAPKLVL